MADYLSFGNWIFGVRLGLIMVKDSKEVKKTGDGKGISLPSQKAKKEPYRPYVKTREDIEADEIRRYWREYEGEGGAF